MNTFVYMVEQQNAIGVWRGMSIHLSQAEAMANCSDAQRVTPFVSLNPDRAVRQVSARLAARRPDQF